MDRNQLDEIKTRLDLAGIIEKEAGVTFHKAGASLRCGCPIHGGDGENNFSVHGQTWRCFSDCDDSGDLFAWGMKYHGWTFREAVSHYAQLAGLTVSNEPRPATRKPQPAKPKPRGFDEPPPSEDWQEEVSTIVAECYDRLWTPEGDAARRWLNGRGLRDETLRVFMVGYNPVSRKIGEHWVYGGITIPHLAGFDLWGVKIRLNKDGLAAWRNIHKRDDAPKYMTIKGSKQNLFNVDSLHDKEFAFVCEGEFDTMLLYQELGDLAGAVTLGSATNDLADRWVKPLLSIRRFYLALDNDEAGHKANAKWQALTGKRARSVAVPAGMDVTDMHQSGIDLRIWGACYLPVWDAAAGRWVEFAGPVELQRATRR